MNIDANDIIDDLIRRNAELTKENAIKAAHILALEKKIIENQQEEKEEAE